MQSTLIILAHGSTDPGWQTPFRQLEERLQQRLGKHVRLAYMELSSPLLKEVIEDIGLHTDQQQRVDILPLFFAAGRHLRKDVPEQLDELGAHFPLLEINLLAPVGQHPAFVDVIAEIVAERSHNTR